MDDRFAALGAHPDGPATRFAAYATTARECSLRLYDADERATATRPMTPLGGGHFALSAADAPPGTLYRFVLDGRELPDPYARFLPRGVHGPARVTRAAHAWRHPPVRRPLAEQVIYELHVGAFTPEGTYAAAAARLAGLAALGVTTVELMPLAAFAGERGWGYDGVAPFAPHAPYGTPDELRAFVDAAHGLGLGVLLDVVYNHLGPAGNYLSAYSPDYFTSAARNAWGDAPDVAHPAMRSLVLSNARYWLEEFRFDGLRLDAVHAIVDPSPRHAVAELAAMAHALDPAISIVGEDDRNDASLVTAAGLDALWADDLHHALHVTLTGERDGYYGAYSGGAAEVARAIARGWLYEGQAYGHAGKARGTDASALPASAFVYCLQNHDQVGNRAHGDRLTAGVSVDAWCAASAVLLFVPMTPLLFMGQEWAASTPFLYFTDHEPGLGALVTAGRREEFKRFRAFSDPAAAARIPDPQARETFTRSRLRWEERDAEPHARVLALYRALLALRRADPVLRASTREGLAADAAGPVLRVRRERGGEARVLLANLSPTAADVGALLPDGGAALLTTGAPLAGGALPAWTAVIVGARR